MRLLIVGTLGGHISSAGKIALSRGAKVSHVDNVEDALKSLRAGQGADLLMIDMTLDIAQMVKALKTERFNIPIVACGIGADADGAVRATKAGAKEYVPLPPDAELIATVFEAVAQENDAILHRDPAMKAVLELADQFAPADASVLINGESGTGKELMARYIHGKSGRPAHKFVAINCAAIPENLLESELFGHEKGSFTGAVARRIGKFEEASGGTLLLDEISEMHPRLQAKLLRVVQEREIDRVGGTQPIKVNVRLIATSNRNLEECVNNGEFREDLFFRLNVVSLRVPPLRERAKDIPILAEHFIAKYAESNGVATPTISKLAMEQLIANPWRGNVRELENTMHRALLLTRGEEIAPETIVSDLSAAPAAAQAATPQGAAGDASHATDGLVGRTVAEVERVLIIETLQHCLGNRTHAANILGISIRTLRNKLKQYSEEGVAVPMPGEAEPSLG